MTFPQTPLQTFTEIFINNVWTNISPYVQVRDGGNVVISRGTPDETTTATTSPATMQLYLNNRDGRFSPRNPVGAYYGQIGRNTPIRFSVTGASFLQIAQQTGTTVGTAYVSAADGANLSVTGDIDIRFEADLTSWRDIMTLVSKWTITGNQRSYFLSSTVSGKLLFQWSTNGTNVLSVQSTIPVPQTYGRLAVRVTLQVNNGSSGNTVTFYTSNSITGTWTILGTAVVTSGTTSIFDSTSPCYILDAPDDGQTTSIHGRVIHAQIYNGISGTLVADPDFTIQANGTTSFGDGPGSTGNTWNVANSLGSLNFTNNDPRFIGEISAWPQMWDTTGKDVWVPVTASDILRRLGQGAPQVQSSLRKALSTTRNLIAYWPLEDGASATQGSSGLTTNNVPMRVVNGANGPVTWAADDSFPSSLPLPQFNGASLSGQIGQFTSSGQLDIRFILSIPSGGTVDGSNIMRLDFKTGTTPLWVLTYAAATGVLTLTAKDANNTAQGNIATTGSNFNGLPVYMQITLQTSGSNVNAQISWVTLGSSGANVAGGTITGVSISALQLIRFNFGLSMQDVTIGHVSIASAIGVVAATAFQSYAGEDAVTRMLRLSASTGINFQVGGTQGAVLMGPQGIDTYLNLMQECVDADGGILFTPRDWLALAYRPNSALYGRVADVTLSYTANQLYTLQPVEDDQSVHNDVTVSRTNGSSYEAVATTGTLSVNAPPLGVGTYATSVTLNVYADSQLDDEAGWMLYQGTIDLPRYPVIDINMAQYEIASNAALVTQLIALDVGSRLVVTNPPAWLPPDPISQLILGYTETIDQYTRTITANCEPSSSYDNVAYYGITSFASRYSPDSSALTAGATSTATTFSASTTPPWTTTDVPFDISVAGERCTVTSVSGTSSSQTLTVTRSVNGVVKAQVSGASIALYMPSYYAL